MKIRELKGFIRRRPVLIWLATAGFAACVIAGTLLQTKVSAAEGDAVVYKNDPQALIVAYHNVEVASVSDAVEQLLHQRMYLSHRMQPLFPAKFAEYVLTVRLKKQGNLDPRSMECLTRSIAAKRALYT